MTKKTRETKRIEAKNNGSKIVNFMFKNYEVRGGDLKFSYLDHETPLNHYRFFDGQKHSAPYSVAKHIHFNTSYPVHQHKQDENGKYIIRVGEMTQRYGIIPLDFIFDQQEQSTLVTVERMNSGLHQLSV